MKNKLTIIYLLGIAILFSSTSCESFLEEENLSSVSDQTYLVSESAFEELVHGAYNPLRETSKFRKLDFRGTDVYTRGEKVQGDDPLNDYTNLTSSDGSAKDGWKKRFMAIADCNAVVTRADEISNLSESLKNLRLAEVKTIRAMHYFYLVQQFGGVPIVEGEVRDVKVDFVRNTEAEVYSFIVADLEEAINNLPASTDQFGRITKGAAQHLLAKVYLTRGYNSYGSSDDFTKAAQLAESVIGSGQYRLLDTFAEVFDYDNQKNDEVIFSVQFSPNQLFNGDANNNDNHGNNQYQLFKFGAEMYPGMNRTSDYGRANPDFMPTSFFFSLFIDEDSREKATLNRTLYAVEDAPDIGISTGDTIIHFPKIAWSQAEKDAVNYFVYNPDEYIKNTEFGDIQFPYFKKFDDPLAPYGDNGGFRDTYLYRLAETYLIAAEAYLQSGNSAKALEYVNVIRTRGAETGMESAMTLSSVNIDVILDERAIELAGEVSRWIDLKRTGKLSERALMHNPHVQLHHTSAIDDHYLLRPIPESEILLTGGALIQNPGY